MLCRAVLSIALAAAIVGSAGADSDGTKVKLFLLPHTHADVGWLELPEALARMNVSRILSGVVGNLANDTSGKRRFVWDEMYFLHWCVRGALPSAASGSLTRM